MYKTNLFFYHPTLQPLGNLSHKSSSKNAKKMDLQLILNKNSPQAHMELEYDMPESLWNM